MMNNVVIIHSLNLHFLQNHEWETGQLRVLIGKPCIPKVEIKCMVGLCICFESVHTYLAVKIMDNDLNLMKVFSWRHRERSLCAMAYSQSRSWDLEVTDPTLHHDFYLPRYVTSILHLFVLW